MNNSNKKNSEPDKHLEKLKQRKNQRWLEWLRRPGTLRLIFRIGLFIFKLLKWLIEMLN
ncbi:hypothetical protein V2H45_24595 [Tumidithrix elongata RA019]|uniref:Uncharacterized protein n=1 Tax=Tumidithrix elongata BACA0141 TaxID=2716417 RepID=A0AAW9Q7I5_9CYAN|nr:hypothetical protein [Tumidithrix elongata RA019]